MTTTQTQTTIYTGTGRLEYIVQVTNKNQRYVATVHVFADNYRTVRRTARTAATRRGIEVGSTEDMYLLGTV